MALGCIASSFHLLSESLISSFFWYTLSSLFDWKCAFDVACFSFCLSHYSFWSIVATYIQFGFLDQLHSLTTDNDFFFLIVLFASGFFQPYGMNGLHTWSAGARRLDCLSFGCRRSMSAGIVEVLDSLAQSKDQSHLLCACTSHKSY